VVNPRQKAIKKKAEKKEAKKTDKESKENVVEKLKQAFENVFLHCDEFIEEQRIKIQSENENNMRESMISVGGGNLFSNSVKFSFPPLIGSSDFSEMNPESMASSLNQSLIAGGVSKSGLGVSGSRGNPEKSMMLPAIGEDEEYPQPQQIEGSSNHQIENSYHVSSRNFFFSNRNRVRVFAPASIGWNFKNGRSDPRYPTPARSATASVYWWLYNHTPTTVCRHGNPTSASWRPATTTASDAFASGSGEKNGSE
jgi:hypothetical protein